LKNKKKNIQSMDQITPLRMSNGRMEQSGGKKKGKKFRQPRNKHEPTSEIKRKCCPLSRA
jgi:hypothetical protein